MSFPPLTASVPPAPASDRTGEHLVQELATLVEEIQRTRDWFNAQIDSQLNSLRKLRAAMQPVAPPFNTSVATLFHAPPPAAVPEAAVAKVAALDSVPASPPASASTAMVAPAQSLNGNGVKHEHEAIVLPPTHIAALDPELEQATLRELNDALSRAFSEISARGGMLG